MKEYWCNVYINRKTGYMWHGTCYAFPYIPTGNFRHSVAYRIHVRMKNA